jgi:predicted  nucleic acid-binding Zn-ribbon protein
MMTIIYIVCWVVSVGMIGLTIAKYRALYSATLNISKAAFYDDLDAKISILSRERDEIEASLAELRSTAGQAQLDAEAALRQKLAEERELETVRSEILRIGEQIKQLEPEREELRKTREHLDRTRLELSDCQRQLSEQMSKLGKAQAEMASALTKREEALRDLRSCEERLPSLRAESATLETRVQVLRNESAQVQEDLVTRRQRLKATEAEIRALEAKRIELEGKLNLLAQQISAAERVLAETVDSIKQQQSKAQRLEADVNRLQQAAAALKLDKQGLEERIQALKVQQQERANELKALKSQVKDERETLESVREQAEAYGREAQSAAYKRQSLENQIEQYQKLLDSVMKTAAQQGGYVELSVDEALKDLTQPINLAFNLGMGDKETSEERALEALVSGLTDQGLHFHQRVLAAFHTSLKTSDFNQLTVLAGVSGTGKSALPRAYAKAMGIHSLVVPVQPGWAGPQDLLGFFNYLERKYKATDLSRYMALFSKYAKSDLVSLNFPAAGSRGSEMLLVLLDEMNLARVEYYFSEFLSRLETRPTINPDDETQRRQVAIPLETGPIQSNAVRPVLYPDANILFVGTMNEDESTQSLSDKVVDRANVLRFGAPNQFRKQPEDIAGRMKMAQQSLSRELWEAWCSPKRAGVDAAERLKVLNELIPDLSATMDRLGRPFGYRVHEAMQRYIIAYPRLNGSKESQIAKWALSDQFEQKIIPKLRGLDTDERAADLRKLGELIGRLEDAPLDQGFRNAIGRPTFEWSGLDRPVK